MAAPEKKHSQAATSLLLANLGFFDSEIPNELENKSVLTKTTIRSSTLRKIDK